MADPFGIVGGCLLLITSLILLGATSVSWHGIAVPSRGPYITVSRFPRWVARVLQTSDSDHLRRLYAAGSIITLLLFVCSGTLTTVRASSSRIAPERATRAIRLLLAFGRLGGEETCQADPVLICSLHNHHQVSTRNHEALSVAVDRPGEPSIKQAESVSPRAKVAEEGGGCASRQWFVRLVNSTPCTKVQH